MVGLTVSDILELMSEFMSTFGLDVALATLVVVVLAAFVWDKFVHRGD